MARGWESKSVAAQMESAADRKRRLPGSGDPDQDYVEWLRKKEVLLLSRTRVMRELETSQNSRYKQMLGRALAELDSQLSALEKASIAKAAST